MTVKCHSEPRAMVECEGFHIHRLLVEILRGYFPQNDMCFGNGFFHCCRSIQNNTLVIPSVCEESHLVICMVGDASLTLSMTVSVIPNEYEESLTHCFYGRRFFFPTVVRMICFALNI